VNTIRERLAELREEYRKGGGELEALDRRRREVSDTLLRITGAIQVLEELLAGADPPVLELAAED
jgi:hypothetical protein